MEGGGGGGGNKGNRDADDAKEKDAARSFVSFLSEKEKEEPCPLPPLSVMMDPDSYQFVQTTKHKDDNDK